MPKLLSRFLADESGQTAIEYGLIAGMIICAIITVVRRVGTNLSAKLNVVSGALS